MVEQNSEKIEKKESLDSGARNTRESLSHEAFSKATQGGALGNQTKDSMSSNSRTQDSLPQLSLQGSSIDRTDSSGKSSDRAGATGSAIDQAKSSGSKTGQADSTGRSTEHQTSSTGNASDRTEPSTGRSDNHQTGSAEKTLKDQTGSAEKTLNGASRTEPHQQSTNETTSMKSAYEKIATDVKDLTNKSADSGKEQQTQKPTDGIQRLSTGDIITKNDNNTTLTTPGGDKIILNKDGTHTINGDVKSTTTDKNGQTTVTFGDGSTVSFDKDGFRSIKRGDKGEEFGRKSEDNLQELLERLGRKEKLPQID